MPIELTKKLEQIFNLVPWLQHSEKTSGLEALSMDISCENFGFDLFFSLFRSSADFKVLNPQSIVSFQT
jgi:hypothetical protein